MPDWWMTGGEYFGQSKGGADSGQGEWALVHDRDWWQMELSCAAGRTFSFEAYLTAGFAAVIDISGDQPPYSLWFYVGDRDKGRVS
jgi:hypothetical protein